MPPAVAKCHKIFPIVAVSLVFLNGCQANKTVLEEVSEQVYTVEPTAEIRIQNRDGAVLVYGADANELRVRAVRKAYTRERLSEIAIEISATARAISVGTKFPPQPKWALWDRSGTVDYTIVVPESASISALDLNAGEVLLDGLYGPQLRARLNDGRIFARNCFANLDITLKRGTLGLSYDWWEEERFSTQASLGQGNAWVWLPTEAAFHLLADVVHGKIANDFNDLPIRANSSTKQMKIDQIVNGGGSAIIKVRVADGNVKIAEANP